MKRLTLILTLALAVFAFGCSQQETTTAPTPVVDNAVDDSIPADVLPENWVANPIPDDLAEQMLNTPLSQQVGLNKVQIANGGLLAPINPVARPTVAIVPLGHTRNSVSYYHYTYDPATGAASARIIEVIDDPTENRLRVWTDLTQTDYLDIHLDDNGVMTDLTSSMFKWGPDWECVATRVITLINVGGQSGLTAACIDLCVLGGPSNPGCIACVIGAAGTLGWIIWDCW